MKTAGINILKLTDCGSGLLGRFLLLYACICRGATQCCSKVQILQKYWGLFTGRIMIQTKCKKNQMSSRCTYYSGQIQENYWTCTFIGLSLDGFRLSFARTCKRRCQVKCKPQTLWNKTKDANSRNGYVKVRRWDDTSDVPFIPFSILPF